jgi:diguanylate cyclase (GGDEF)-like protein
MELYIDRKRTLLPRIDAIYVLARLMLLVVIGWYAFFGPGESAPRIYWTVILGTFLLQSGYVLVSTARKLDIRPAYVVSLVYDLALVPFLVYHTGGVDSSFYLVFCLTVSIAAYVLTLPVASATVILGSAGYLTVVFPQLTADNYFNVIVRLGFIWIYYLVISYALDYFRRSESRMLKLFNTLNMRTSELEKSQAQLEHIYENSRVLASILDTEGLVLAVDRIMGRVFAYNDYAIILITKGGYQYRVRCIDGVANYTPEDVDVCQMEIIRRVGNIGEPVRIPDTRSRRDYVALGRQTRSAMAVPMVARGHASGVLLAESAERDHFNERDIQLLSIVARSAAMALENAALHKRTEELTIMDELTRAFNYRHFVKKLDEEKKRAARYKMPLSIIMVDIDHFKRFNDTNGHEAGNVVLRELAKIIKGCIRDVDIFARYGGEEFVIVLPQTDLRAARVIGERIREQIEAHKVHLPESGPRTITVSVGVSSYPENGRSEDELVDAADKALYQAKGDGRNMVCTL